MQTVTLSTKYQLVIPRDIRTRLDLEPGTKLTVVEKGGILYLVPERPVEEMRGVARGTTRVAGSSTSPHDRRRISLRPTSRAASRCCRA
jgi:AbrB family looped-hinge helix DNA binding protein